MANEYRVHFRKSGELLGDSITVEANSEAEAIIAVKAMIDSDEIIDGASKIN